MATIYPWDAWLSTRRLKLTKGRHFHCGLASFVQQLRNEASKRGLRVSVIEDDGTIRIEVKNADEDK